MLKNLGYPLGTILKMGWGGGFPIVCDLKKIPMLKIKCTFPKATRRFNGINFNYVDCIRKIHWELATYERFSSILVGIFLTPLIDVKAKIGIQEPLLNTLVALLALDKHMWLIVSKYLKFFWFSFGFSLKLIGRFGRVYRVNMYLFFGIWVIRFLDSKLNVNGL